MKSFTEEIREGLLSRGWEIYEGRENPNLYEWWWKPAEHKDYWSVPYEPDAPKRDWYMPIDQAIGQQMLADKRNS